MPCSARSWQKFQFVCLRANWQRSPWI